MNIKEKVLFIQQNETKIKNASDKEGFEAIKMLTDNFTDLADDLFDEKSIAGIEKLFLVLQGSPSKGDTKSTKSEQEPVKQESAKSAPKKDKKQAKPKEVFQGEYVRKETAEHIVIKKFLALRKQVAPAALCLNAYVKLQKKLTSGEISKSNVHNSNLIMSIQGAYYNFLKGKDKELTLSEEKLIEASKLVANEKKYGTVRMMSEFVGWTGKTKTMEQIKSFINRSENVLKDSPKNAPYFEELQKAIKELSQTEPSMSIVPESIGLEGLGSNFAFHVR